MSNGSATVPPKSARQQIMEWVYKFSDDLANFFGGLFVLFFGLIIFVIVVNAIDYYPKWKAGNPWILAGFIALALVGAFLSLQAMFHFARQFDDESQNQADDFVYRLNDFSLETLRTIGVGRDVVKSLKAQLEKSSSSQLDMTLSPDASHGWLDELEKDIGTARLEECREIVLRYTRRPKDTPDENQTSEPGS